MDAIKTRLDNYKKHWNEQAAQQTAAALNSIARAIDGFSAAMLEMLGPKDLVKPAPGLAVAKRKVSS